MAGRVHDGVRAEMRLVLSDAAPVSLLNQEAAKLLAEARTTYARLELDKKSVIQFGSEVRIFTWRGDWVNDTLTLMLGQKGIRAANEGICLVAFNAEHDHLKNLLYDIARDVPPTPEALAQPIQNKIREKWDWLLTDTLLCKSFASEELDVPGAMAEAIAATESTGH